MTGRRDGDGSNAQELYHSATLIEIALGNFLNAFGLARQICLD